MPRSHKGAVMPVEPNRHHEWGRDAAQYPFSISCDAPKCFWHIGHKGPEDAALAALERHMQSDGCPRPLLYHGKGVANGEATLTGR